MPKTHPRALVALPAAALVAGAAVRTATGPPAAPVATGAADHR